MIKVFTRFRQNMLAENKFSKYLLYAIGEIVLVVIGILIAVNINNWNEKQKNQTDAQFQLSKLKDNLQSDQFDISKFAVPSKTIEDYKNDRLILSALRVKIQLFDGQKMYYLDLQNEIDRLILSIDHELNS